MDVRDRLEVLEMMISELQAQNKTILQQLSLLVDDRLEAKPISPTPDSNAEDITPSPRISGKHKMKPSPPNDFNGDRHKGCTFLNSCQLYVAITVEQFPDPQAMIHWALSYMKTG